MKQDTVFSYDNENATNNNNGHQFYEEQQKQFINTENDKMFQ